MEESAARVLRLVRSKVAIPKKTNTDEERVYVPRARGRKARPDRSPLLQVQLDTPQLPTMHRDFVIWCASHGNVSYSDVVRWLVSDLVYGPPRQLPWEDDSR